MGVRVCARILAAVLALVSYIIAAAAVESCKDLTQIKENNAKIDVFWINLDASVARRKYMERQLAHFGFTNNYRITAATPRDLLLPTRLAHPDLCNFLSEATIQEFTKSANIEQILHATSVTNTVDPHRDIDTEIDIGSTNANFKRNKHAHLHGNSEYTALISDHCGRKKNSLRELTVTASHLKALYFAVRSLSKPTASAGPSSRYALILEDDVLFPHALKVDELLKAAPPNFAMIQFVTTNERYLQQHWQQYSRTGDLWTLRGELDLWCASAYLIDKEKLRDIINSIVIDIGNNTYRHRIVAGYSKPCFPSQCCDDMSNGPASVLIPKGHCVHAARGYQADNYIFALRPADTYISNVPLVTGGRVGFNSTIHQEHVHSHHAASFSRVNGYTEEMTKGMVKPPPFMAMDCAFAGH
jgi:GR25 family glycosyltransferase involved in LPS biosynthesis